MSLRGVLIGGSLLAHGGLVVALGALRAPPAISATAIEVTETTKPEPPAPPPPPPPEPASPAVHEAPQRARTAKPAAEPTPEAPTPTASPLAALPDFGLELSGASGPGGLALPAAAPPPRAAQAVTKTLEKAPAPKRALDSCDEPPAKPKLLRLPQPAYSESARAAGVEGKVRLEISVDETGKVVEVRALTSLGHGLDEAAIAAARLATFEPAVRCGRPTRSTFTVAVRFSAS
ncbi:MAG: TonB family protein [Labilithrix sp.]|nr:TonB family protein [Labilithrix sp.]